MGVPGLKSKILTVVLRISHHLTAYFFWIMFYLIFNWFWREEGQNIDLLFHELMHSLVGLVCVQTGIQTCNVGVSWWCSDQLNSPARAPPSPATYETPLLYITAAATLAFGSSSDVTAFPPVGFCANHVCPLAPRQLHVLFLPLKPG